MTYEEKILTLSEWDRQRPYLYFEGWHYNGINEDGYVVIRRQVS